MRVQARVRSMLEIDSHFDKIPMALHCGGPETPSE